MKVISDINLSYPYHIHIISGYNIFCFFSVILQLFLNDVKLVFTSFTFLLLKMLLEYLSNMWVLPLIATIIGLTIVYLYDLFEKKQYTNAIYIRIGILIYISCLATIYISRLQFLQVGGAATPDMNTQNLMPQPNELRNTVEHFKTGIPAF